MRATGIAQQPWLSTSRMLTRRTSMSAMAEAMSKVTAIQSATIVFGVRFTSISLRLRNKALLKG